MIVFQSKVLYRLYCTEIYIDICTKKCSEHTIMFRNLFSNLTFVQWMDWYSVFCTEIYIDICSKGEFLQTLLYRNMHRHLCKVLYRMYCTETFNDLPGVFLNTRHCSKMYNDGCSKKRSRLTTLYWTIQWNLCRR